MAITPENSSTKTAYFQSVLDTEKQRDFVEKLYKRSSQKESQQTAPDSDQSLPDISELEVPSDFEQL